MRRTVPWRGRVLVALLALCACSLTGAGAPKKKKIDGPPLKAEETVANIAYIVRSGELKLEGIGLVYGLENTGVDPPPSYWRQQLLDEMRKAGVENANRILADPRFALVIVHASIPPGTNPSDRLDVTVELPPASGTTSLAGGYLLSTRLREIMIAGGAPKQGPEMAHAQGPVMVGSEAKPDNLKVGRVLGGARTKKEFPLHLVIKDNRRSFRTAAMLQDVVNRRFHQTQGVEQQGVAKAKTDEFLVLQIPRIYHHNQDRYFRVIKLLQMVETPALRAQRTETWAKDLLEPATAGVAALRLEGLGPSAIEVLKPALASTSSQVRFFAAETLAYLNDSTGTDVLATAAVETPEFRSYALAALAAVDQPGARMKLLKLMDTPDIEVRYGAFNALRTLDESDPFLGRVRVLDPLPTEEETETDSMSLVIARASARRRTQDDPFALYLVDCQGPPMIHVARTRRCEVVLFGRDQQLLPPAVLGTGPYLLNASDGDTALQVSKIVPSKGSDGDEKVTSSLELADVIRRTANLGAKYPEIVQILQAAAKQRNLPGPLVIDAVPGASPLYVEAILGKDMSTKKDDKLKQAGFEAEKRDKEREKAQEAAKKPGFFRRLLGRGDK